MKITNRLGLPEPFVQMASSDYQYKPDRYSVTSLLKGTRETILERRHASEIEQDVSECIWMLFGTAAHSILESQQETADQIKEASISTVIDGTTISGRFDLYDSKSKTITDYKTCSVWKIIFGDYEDWRKQILIYAYLMRKTGFEVNRGEVVAVMRDHKKSEAKYKPEYPKYPVKLIKFKFAEQDFDSIRFWLEDKVAEIKQLEILSDDQLPLCTLKERFNSGDKYAVMAKGKKRALRVLDDYEQATQWRDDNGGDSIDIRPGEDKKCKEYCSACAFCSHWQENYGGKNNG